MIQARIVSPWAGAGTNEDPYRAQLFDDYQTLQYTDASNMTTPPPLGIMVADVVMDDGLFTALEADGDYHVLWDAPNPRPPQEQPPANEWGQLRAYLAQNGLSQAQIRAAIGQNVNGRTRHEIAEALRLWLQSS